MHVKPAAAATDNAAVHVCTAGLGACRSSGRNLKRNCSVRRMQPQSDNARAGGGSRESKEGEADRARAGGSSARNSGTSNSAGQSVLLQPGTGRKNAGPRQQTQLEAMLGIEPYDPRRIGSLGQQTLDDEWIEFDVGEDGSINISPTTMLRAALAADLHFVIGKSINGTFGDGKVETPTVPAHARVKIQPSTNAAGASEAGAGGNGDAGTPSVLGSTTTANGTAGQPAASPAEVERLRQLEAQRARTQHAAEQVAAAKAIKDAERARILAVQEMKKGLSPLLVQVSGMRVRLSIACVGLTPCSTSISVIADPPLHPRSIKTRCRSNKRKRTDARSRLSCASSAPPVGWSESGPTRHRSD